MYRKVSQLSIYICPLFYRLLSYTDKYKVLGRVLRTLCICVCLCKNVTYKRVAKSICLTDSLFCQNSPSQDNHDGMITHLEPDMLECEVKWALERFTMNKVSGGDGIPVELFQILKDDAVKVLHSICQQIWKISSCHRTGKDQFSFQSQRKAMPKNAQTTAQLYSSHILVK